jgi:hypothetical protein
MVGTRFGGLTALGRAPKIDQYARFRCRCDCGSLTEVRGAHLTAGQTSGSDIAFARSFPIGVIARQKSDANPSETGLDETRFGGADHVNLVRELSDRR